MNISALIYYAVGALLALFVIKIMIRIPLMLITIGLLAALAYAAYHNIIPLPIR
ncbi:MAG: hypothetical protein IJ852_00965 [Alphaproteobacteria bacterium]|nr:hypothetical protein [Alphaproteobacteria bacterium]